MREFMDLIENAEIISESFEPTTYGYWIDASGKLIPVMTEQSHYEVVWKYWPSSRFSNSEYIIAMKHGWVRVVSYRCKSHTDFSADTYGSFTSKKALATLIKLANTFSDAPSLNHTDELLDIQKKCDDPKAFAASIRQVMDIKQDA